MLGFLIRILGNSAALYVATYFLSPAFIITGGIKEYLLAGVALGLLNMIVRPALKLVLSPIIIITLGLFIIVINALMLWLVDYAFVSVPINNLTTLVWATLIVSLVNMVVATFTKTID